MPRRTTLAPWRDQLADPAARAALGRALAPLLTPDVTDRLPGALAFDPAGGDIDTWIDRADGIAEVHTISRTDTGALAGLLLLSPVPGAGRDRAVGYFLGREHWGQGLASDMLTGLVEALDGGPPCVLFAGTDAGNRASQRVLEKVGFTRDRSETTPDRITFSRRCGG